MKVLWASLFCSMLMTPATLAQGSTVQANPDGDYSRTDHKQWVVVDSDPAGLNCRWSDAMPDEWYAPDAQFPPMNIRQWPVVARFEPGTILTANLTPAGFVLLYDDRYLPWLKVSIGKNDRICLVRANQRFIRPVD